MGRRLIAFAVSVAPLVATEMFFPLEEPAGPTAVKQKHFWDTMMFIFSLILGLPVESSLQMEMEVRGCSMAEARIDQSRIPEARSYFRKLRLAAMQSGRVVKMEDPDG